MSPNIKSSAHCWARFLRVSGDEPVRKGLNALAFLFSPRERG